MNATEFKEKYPQYQDWDDNDLAEGLYTKFYSNKVPKEQFMSQFLPRPGLGSMALEGVRASIGGTVGAVGGWTGSEGITDAGKAITGEQHEPVNLAENMAKDIGYWGTDIATLFVPGGQVTKGIKGLKYLQKAGEAVKLASKGGVAAATVPALAHEAATFGLVSGFKGGPEGAVEEGAKGMGAAVPFVLSRLPASRLLRIGALAVTGGGLAAVEGGDRNAVLSAGILMGLLGAFSPQIKDKIIAKAGEKPEANIDDIVKEVGVKPEAWEQMKMDFIPTASSKAEVNLRQSGLRQGPFPGEGQLELPYQQTVESPLGAVIEGLKPMPATYEPGKPMAKATIAGELPLQQRTARDVATGMAEAGPNLLEQRMDIADTFNSPLPEMGKKLGIEYAGGSRSKDKGHLFIDPDTGKTFTVVGDKITPEVVVERWLDTKRIRSEAEAKFAEDIARADKRASEKATVDMERSLSDKDGTIGDARESRLIALSEEEWAQRAEFQRVQETTGVIDADTYTPPMKPMISDTPLPSSEPRVKRLRKRAKELEQSLSPEYVAREAAQVQKELLREEIASASEPRHPVQRALHRAEKVAEKIGQEELDADLVALQELIARKPVKSPILSRQEVRDRLLKDREGKVAKEKVEPEKVQAREIISAADVIELRAKFKEINDRLAKDGSAELSDVDRYVLTTVGKLKEKKLSKEEAYGKAEGLFNESVDTGTKLSLDELVDIEQGKGKGKKPSGPKFYSGVPADAIWEAVKPLVELAVAKGKLVTSDIVDFSKGILRVPFWNPSLRNLSMLLHKIETSAKEFSSRAQELMRSYFLLKKGEVRDAVDQLILLTDKRGKVATQAELNALPGKRVVYKGKEMSEGAAAYLSVREGLDFLFKKMLRSAVRQLWKEAATDEEIAAHAGIDLKTFYKLPTDKMTVLRDKLAYDKAEDFLASSYLPAYFPRYRFGRFVAIVTRKSDNRLVHSEAFDLQKDAEALVGRFGNTGKDTRIVDLKNFGGDYKEILSVGSYLPMLERLTGSAKAKVQLEVGKLKEVLGAQYEEYLGSAAQGKLLHRYDIPGYSTDVRKSLLSYTDNFPNGVLRTVAKPRIAEHLSTLPNEHGIRKYGNELYDYFEGRTSKEGKINIFARKGMYLFYLALKPAYGILNWTQRLTMTTPWAIDLLAEHMKLNMADASSMGMKIFASAQGKEMRLVKDVISSLGDGKNARLSMENAVRKADYLSLEERYVLLRLFRQGEMRQMRQIEVSGKDSQVMKYLDIFGFLSERSNRIHAALMGTEIYTKLAHQGGMKGMKRLVDNVDNFLNATQIMYSKANRPVLGRGILAPAFMFKSYMFNFLQMYWKMLGHKNKAGFTMGVGTMLALGGLGGLPFYTNEVDAMVDFFMGSVAKDPTWAVTKRQIAEGMNEKMGKYVLHGLPSALGIDASGMVGFPDVTSLAVTPLVKAALKLPETFSRVDMTTAEKYRAFFPSEARKLYDIYWRMQNGMPTNAVGKPLFSEKDVKGMPKELRQLAMEMYEKLPKGLSATEKVSMALGFPTLAVNKYYSDVSALKQARWDMGRMKAEYHRAIAMAILEGKRDRAQALADVAKKKGMVLNSESIWGHLVEYNEALAEDNGG